MSDGEKKCPRCAEMVKADALVCRFCGHEFGSSQAAAPKVLKKRAGRASLGCLFALLIGIVIAVVLSKLVQPGSELASSPLGVDTQMRTIKNKVAEDAVKQYNIARDNGSKMDRCVQAGMVAAAYLQAQDQARYAEWKDTEKQDCDAAGLKR